MPDQNEESLAIQLKLSLGKKGYPIRIESGILGRSWKGLATHFGPRKVAIVTSPKLFHWYGKGLSKALARSGIQSERIFINDSEKRKNEKTLFAILKKMAGMGLHRDSGLVALGGGVIGDMTGLAASLYMRGIPYVQFPTTLLAQVDASIGGKTAIDFEGFKNLIGSFHQPKAVLIDPLALQTLPERQFVSGLAEVVKYGVIKDERFFRFLEINAPGILEREPEKLERIIAHSARIKAEVVSADEKECNLRAILNYGHTLGHALESYFDYGLLTHGEAIAYGMWFAGSLSHLLGLCPKVVADRQIALLSRLGLFKRMPKLNNKTILGKMALDKKSKGGKIQFILTRKIGLVTIRKNIPQSTILSALNRLQAEASELI
jgi:3-dehydroquinate synthase